MLGCDYLGELNLGRNAQFSSEQSRDASVPITDVEEQILSDLQSSAFFSLMTDKSTDIAVLKQLVLVERCLHMLPMQYLTYSSLNLSSNLLSKQCSVNG